jgi:hypothetical protein
MSRGRSLLLHVAAGAILTGFALAPLWRAGLVGADLALFPADGSRVVGLSALGNASLELTRSLFGTPSFQPDLAVRALRAENALYLFLACLVFSALLRRTLRAWLGDEVGFAAQRAAVVLLPLHPWCVLAVASASARGELLGLFFAALSAFSFLRARQEGEQRWFVASLALALAAGWASSETWLLAPLCGILEWIVARRHRSALARVRTTVTTLAGFAAATLVPQWLSGRPVLLPELDAEALADWLTGLGRVLVPLHPSEADLARAALAGAALLLVLQPALVAARSAPRTWGRFALAWGLLILVCLLPAPLGAARASADLASLRWLCAPALCLGAACATAATAHSGWKRASFPWILALALLALDRPIVRAWPAATRCLEALVGEIARQTPPRAAEFVLLSPPREERGLQLVPEALASRWLARAAGLERELVLADSAQLSAWAASASFPGEVFVLQPSSSPEAPFLADVLPATRGVQRRASADERQSWRETRGSHTVRDIDPQWLRCVRVRLRPDAAHSGRPRIAWHSEDGAPSATAQGVWIEGGDAPVALFDLARDPRWLLCGRVRSIWFEGPEPEGPLWEALPALPEPALAEAPREQSGRWSARLSATQPAESAAPGLTWQLALFDPRTLESQTLAGRLAPGGELEFPAPAEWSGRAGLEWSLEARLGKACVARISGRR